MLYLLVFGNPYLNEDNLAITIADSMLKDRVKGIEIVKCISPEEVMNYTDKDFMILDVVKGAKDVMFIEDIDRLKASNTVTMHDFDLGFFLKLMKETGQINSVRIIGMPQEGDIGDLKKKILSLIPIPSPKSA
jgi:Ni,Fe-hydrogenase maturation factor